MLEKFKQLGLSKETIEVLKKKGFEEPTKIQQHTIPLLLKENIDIVGQAQTGTGKTAAFALPIIEKIKPLTGYIQAFVLVPTRELALQVAEEIDSLKGRRRISIMAIYGGQSISQQMRRIEKGVDIVVGTPGRIKDHLQRKSIDLSKVSFAVLDEADEMLNMGFIDDVTDILSYSGNDKRTLLFSATMPSSILRLAKKYMRDYKIIKVDKEQLTVSLTDQIYFEVSSADKLEALCRIIDNEQDFYGLVFCRTKVDVDTVARRLASRGYNTDGLHGDISQAQRERILEKFRRKRINILIATDVAARGIDISDLTHVINYSLPQDPESYIHRIGRTGRAGKEGTAITFVTPEEYRRLIFIKRVIRTNIRKEKIPSVDSIIHAKKKRIKNEVNEIAKSGKFEEYSAFAKEMLEGKSAEKVLAAFMKYSLEGELDAASYRSIRDVSVDRKGVARLFVARGRVDNVSPKALIKMIQDVVDIESWRIKDIRIFDKFSFITVPFEDAEIILQAFKKIKTSRKPIVERAREKGRRAG